MTQGCRCDQPKCRACTVRRYRARKRAAGGPLRSPSCAAWFDWEAVERAWEGKRVGRTLTTSERLYLTAQTVKGKWEPTTLAHLLGFGMGQDGRRKAAEMAADVLGGRVVVPQPDWLGRV